MKYLSCIKIAYNNNINNNNNNNNNNDNNNNSNKKSYFRASMLGFVDNFELYFESYVLNTQNHFKGALNKVNGLITSKN